MHITLILSICLNMYVFATLVGRELSKCSQRHLRVSLDYEILLYVHGHPPIASSLY